MGHEVFFAHAYWIHSNDGICTVCMKTDSIPRKNIDNLYIGAKLTDSICKRFSVGLKFYKMLLDVIRTSSGAAKMRHPFLLFVPVMKNNRDK